MRKDMKKCSLLDCLYQKMGCDHLSDMRLIPYLNAKARYFLITLEDSRVSDYSVKQWNEAITYLYGEVPHLPTIKSIRIWLALQQITFLEAAYYSNSEEQQALLENLT